MARTKIKCQFILYCLIVSVSTRSLPVIPKSTLITEDAYTTFNTEAHVDADVLATPEEKIQVTDLMTNSTNRNDVTNQALLRNNVRPGQEIRRYTVELTRNAENIGGRAVIDVRLTDETIGDTIILNALGLDIQSVAAGVLTDANPQPAQFNINLDRLEVNPAQGPASTYILIIEYTIRMESNGAGIYLGGLDEDEYIAMNLHPTNARRVFPCMDEPNLSSITSLSFSGMEFTTMLSNSLLDVDSATTFRSLEGPVHLWAMVAHNLNNINIPVANTVFLYARQGVMNQDAQAGVAMNNYYNALNEWTEKNHAEIILNQNGGLHVVAVPDVARDWYGLSTLCIWEPYILMENNNAVKQRKTALVAIAEGMARQWFGYVIYPENWRYQWVIAGLGSYAAYDIVSDFQTAPPGQEDETLIDMNTIFTVDIIQESLLYDAYTSNDPLDLEDGIFEENVIRHHTEGLLKTKAPALLRMVMLVLSEQRDIVQAAAKALLRSRALQPVTSRNFFDALNSEYSFGIGGSGLVDSVEDFLRPWVSNTGYPVILVGIRQGGVLVTQERFGFTAVPQMNYMVPLTFTTSVNPNFNNIHPNLMMQTTLPINLVLGDEDWIIFNLQGQGYYRVNYDPALWERIIEALSDPETRDDIHPLNRATLIDDSLNLARAGRLDYDVAFEIVLTMEHETDYAVWKAFVRNMDFIKKRLVALVESDEERDPDIYLRMVRRTVIAVEEEIGFVPESPNEPSMLSLTRGLVMDHACRSGYDPCIAAAVDMFYDPNDEETVNPNIPPEIRPAVYCAMVREDEEGDAIEALERRLEIEQSRYERLVILESLACSNDPAFVAGLLENTVLGNSPYVLEERSKIFAAVASSSFENSRIALNFLIGRTGAIRDMYGGPEKLEEAIFVMAENIVDGGQTNDFVRWVNSLNVISNLDDSNMVAEKARGRILENLEWVNERMELAYEWIDENDASTTFVSTLLISLSLLIAIFNQH